MGNWSWQTSLDNTWSRSNLFLVHTCPNINTMGVIMGCNAALIYNHWSKQFCWWYIRIRLGVGLSRYAKLRVDAWWISPVYVSVFPHCGVIPPLVELAEDTEQQKSFYSSSHFKDYIQYSVFITGCEFFSIEFSFCGLYPPIWYLFFFIFSKFYFDTFQYHSSRTIITFDTFVSYFLTWYFEHGLIVNSLSLSSLMVISQIWVDNNFYIF